MKHRQRVPKKQEVITRIRRSKAEIAQYLQDGRSWNDNHPGEEIDLQEELMAAENAKLDGLLHRMRKPR